MDPSNENNQKENDFMKEYLKPEIEYMLFVNEDISTAGGTGDSESNDWSEDDFQPG